MALVPMTKEQFLERWKKDAEKREQEKKEAERRKKSVICAYITESISRNQHRYYRKTSRKGRLSD